MPNTTITESQMTRLGNLVAQHSANLPTNAAEMLVCAITNLTDIKHNQIRNNRKVNPAELTRIIIEANQAICMTNDINVQNCIRNLATEVFNGSMAIGMIAETTESFLAALRIRKQMILDGLSNENLEELETKYGYIDLG